MSACDLMYSSLKPTCVSPTTTWTYKSIQVLSKRPLNLYLWTMQRTALSFPIVNYSSTVLASTDIVSLGPHQPSQHTSATGILMLAKSQASARPDLSGP